MKGSSDIMLCTYTSHNKKIDRQESVIIIYLLFTTFKYVSAIHFLFSIESLIENMN